MVNIRLVVLLVALPFVEGRRFKDLLNLIMGPLWKILVRGTCNAIAPNFDDDDGFGCTCYGVVTSGSSLAGLGGELVCKND